MHSATSQQGHEIVNIRLPEEIQREISLAARERGQDTDSLLAELVSEAYKMLRVPGVVFADGPAGRRARLEGTGVEVFEVVQAFLAEDRDRAQLAIAYHWLDARQLDAALEYFRQFPEDVTPFLSDDDGTFRMSDQS